MPATSEAMNGPSPAALDHVLEQAQAQLATLQDSRELRGRVSWCGLSFSVLVSKQSHQKRLMRLEADLGFLPYSVEDEAARRNAMTDYMALRRAGLPGLSLGLAGPGKVSARADTVINGDQSIDKIYEALALVLMSLGPQLTRLATRLRPVTRA